MATEIGQLQTRYGARGSASYSVELLHRGLHKHRVIRGPDPDVVNSKVRLQAAEWDELWDKKQTTERKAAMASQEKEARRVHLESRKAEASRRTSEAEALLENFRQTLMSGVAGHRPFNWETLKDRTPFPKVALQPPRPGPLPEATPVPAVPVRSLYQPSLSFLDKLISSRREAKEADALRRFKGDLAAWQKHKESAGASDAARLDEYRRREGEAQTAHAKAVEEWEHERQAFLAKQAEQHGEVDSFRMRYQQRESAAVTDYCQMLLSSSEYPDCLPRDFDLDLNAESGVLVLNYRLPAPDDLPTLCEVRYVQSSDTSSEKHLAESQLARLYDDLVYQITLRTVHELFASDEVEALTAIVFNGFVTATDKGTGKEVTACILSLQASKEVFRSIDLAKVDPKACFRQLKGVGSSKLHSITPVAPIMDISREDKRFIESYGVAQQLNEGYNLASMDWEDFEHLIREIFEKEFASAGGEVRVTQASRDGGVDAVAFDPDPIRGGKIVIQAKRYSHTVGVSAVRDLYGTLMNEGATKGILVTTSDYGPDAYEFASGKPITLLNGSNLLHLLQKHGVKAHIDLVEARKAGLERSAATN